MPGDEPVIEEFIRSGSEASFGAVFDTLYRSLFAYFVVRGTDRASAEDLAQEVLLVVYRKVKTLREGSLFRGWMFGIARHYLLHYREEQRKNPETLALEEMDRRPSGRPGSMAVLDARMDCEACLAQLSGEERELVALRYVEGLSYAEIAEALELPVGTVKWRMFHIKSKCAAMARAGVPA